MRGWEETSSAAALPSIAWDCLLVPSYLDAKHNLTNIQLMYRLPFFGIVMNGLGYPWRKFTTKLKETSGLVLESPRTT